MIVRLNRRFAKPPDPYPVASYLVWAEDAGGGLPHEVTCYSNDHYTCTCGHPLECGSVDAVLEYRVAREKAIASLDPALKEGRRIEL